MNKIIIENDTVKEAILDKAITLTFLEKNELFDVSSIKINVTENTNLEIDYLGLDEHKLDIFINVEAGVVFDLFEMRTGAKTKVQYKYYLDINSSTTVYKFYDCVSVKELDIINLNGDNARLDYHFKTISKELEKYDLMIYHNHKNTVCNIYNSGVNIRDGKLKFTVTNIVPNHVTGCVVNQNGRIITLNDNECSINPNLLIEENDIEASHSALIGKFSDEELFYLMSRGINRESAINLLTKGFLLGGFVIREERIKEINDIIDSYWR